jgi:YVTN family beta-propeller protein
MRFRIVGVAAAAVRLEWRMDAVKCLTMEAGISEVTASAQVSSVPLGRRPRWVAVAPDGRRAYLTLDDLNSDGSSFGGVSVVDTAKAEVLATVPVGGGAGGPAGLVVSPSGDKVYVSCWDPTHRSSAVTVLDTATNSVSMSVPLAGTSSPGGIALSPDGQQLYVAAGHTESAGLLIAISTATLTVAFTIDTDPTPTAVVVSPDAQHVYVMNSDGLPSRLDVTTHQGTFLDGLGVLGDGRIAFTPDGRLAYVTSDGTSLVGLFDPATNSFSVAADAPGGSTDVTVTPDGRLALVIQKPGEGSPAPIIKIDTMANTFSVSPLRWQGSADGLAITPDGAHLYVSDRRSSAAVVVPVAAL